MHQAAKSTSQSWSASSTLPAAWARSQPTTAPAAWPAAVRRSISSAWPVAKLTPARKTSARSGPCSAMAASRSVVRTVASPARGPTTTRSATGSRPRSGQVRRQGVAVGREERAVGQDPASPAGRAEERGRAGDGCSTVRPLASARSRSGRAPTIRAIGPRSVSSIVNHGRSGANQASTPRRAQASSSVSIAARTRPRLEPERLAGEIDRRGCRRARRGAGSGRGARVSGSARSRASASASPAGASASVVPAGHLAASVAEGSGRPRVASGRCIDPTRTHRPSRGAVPRRGPRRLCGRLDDVGAGRITGDRSLAPSETAVATVDRDGPRLVRRRPAPPRPRHRPPNRARARPGTDGRRRDRAGLGPVRQFTMGTDAGHDRRR